MLFAIFKITVHDDSVAARSYLTGYIPANGITGSSMTFLPSAVEATKFSTMGDLAQWLIDRDIKDLYAAKIDPETFAYIETIELDLTRHVKKEAKK